MLLAFVQTISLGGHPDRYGVGPDVTRGRWCVTRRHRKESWLSDAERVIIALASLIAALAALVTAIAGLLG